MNLRINTVKVLFLLSIGFDRQTTSGHLLCAVIKRICEDGHSVHILQKNTSGSLPLIPDCLRAYGVTTEAIPFKAVKKSNFIARYTTELKYYICCIRQIKPEYKYVFIQSTPVGGIAVWAVRKKIPNSVITFNVQDIFPYNLLYSGHIKNNSLAFKLLSAIQRYGYRHSNHIITISEDMKNLLIEDGVPKENISVIYNWSYQDAPYENLDNSQVFNMFSSSYFNVVYAGNIGVMQNVDVIIEVANMMKDEEHIRFHIIGDGVYKERLVAKTRDYGLNNTSFYPLQPSSFAPVIYSMADVNIIPLAKGVYRTALPSKTATCLACGKPIIFAIGRESVFGRKAELEAACYLFDSDDVKGISKKIKDISEKKFLGSNFSYFIENFSLSKNSKKYEEIIIKKE